MTPGAKLFVNCNIYLILPIKRCMILYYDKYLPVVVLHHDKYFIWFCYLQSLRFFVLYFVHDLFIFIACRWQFNMKGKLSSKDFDNLWNIIIKCQWQFILILILIWVIIIDRHAHTNQNKNLVNSIIIILYWEYFLIIKKISYKII